MGLSKLKGTLTAEASEDLLSDIQAQLEACSLAGAFTTTVNDETIGLLHQSRLDVDGLAAGIGNAASKFEEDGNDIQVCTSSIDITDTELSEEEMAKAVIYAIQKFTENQGDFTISDLTEGYKDSLQDAGKRIAEIKSLIKLRAFDLVFQPIVDLKKRRVHHYEALVRFRGMENAVSTFETITFAEDVGLISALDVAICERAIETIKEAAASRQDIALAVNISGRSLETPAFIEWLQTTLKDREDLRDHLMFEVTESSKISNLEKTNNFLQSIRDLGHSVSLDDFGAGASAFQYLRELHVDFVKIDGSYVKDIVSDKEKQAFVRSMVALCRDLKIETVAEMIEDDATAKMLRKFGVIYGQGYLFGKPSKNFLKLP